MKLRAFAPAAAVMAVAVASLAHAEPILKARKYHGPIPQSTLSLRVGFTGGANNEEMIEYLDGRLQPPFEALSDDFGTGLVVEAGYGYKPHPHFGLRVNASMSMMESEGTGFFPLDDGDSLLATLDYERKFEVKLFTLELSAVYHFTDAGVKEFQPYLGGGFSLGFPYEKLTESRIDRDTGEPFTEEIPGVPSEASEWDFAAGAHVVGGAIYYFTNRWGISGEGRVQLLEDRFEQIEANDPETGEFEPVNFVVKYTGFLLTLGVTYAF